MNHFALYIIFSIYGVQRIFELILSSKNEIFLKKAYNAIEASSIDSIRMKIFHLSWFLCWFWEAYNSKLKQTSIIFWIFILILILCQWIRFKTMKLLKQFWTIKIFRMNQHPIVFSGLYNYIRHPNYLAVIVELFLVPVLFKAYWTASIFSFLNIFVLKMRIDLEENVLKTQSDYEKNLSPKPKFFPI
jgi:methyltransferase